MPGDDQFVEVYGLLLGHPVETEVVEDEQVRGEKERKVLSVEWSTLA